MNAINFGFFLFPVITKFDFVAHAPLILGQVLFVLLKAAQRGVAAERQ
jgi:hypothetical protein